MRVLAPVAVPAVLLVAFVGAACTDDEPAPPALTLDDLRTAGEACPVDVAEAVAVAGVEEATMLVEVEEGSGEATADASALDRAGGVLVRCSWSAGGGAPVSVEWLGAQEGDAAMLYLPALQSGLGVASDDMQEVADRIDRTGAGTIVDLGTDATVALAPVDIGGAGSGALFVRGPDLAADQVRLITRAALAGT